MKYSTYLAILIFAAMLFTLGVAVPSARGAEPKFRLPLSQNRGYYQYYDNKGGSGLCDWRCGTQTYEEHHGVDFVTNYGDPIYSGATGGIYYRYDGCGDYGSWSSTCGSGYGNHVRIDHEGSFSDGVGWKSIYAHMRSGTTAWYQTLFCGAKIGESASSGKSTAVHLHFEVRKYGHPKDDPFAGSCSGPTSYWVNQNGGWPT